MPTTVTLDDEIAQRCQAEADRIFDGDLNEAVKAGLTHYLAMQDGQHALTADHPPVPGEPEENRLARAVTVAGIPLSAVENIAAILYRVAGAAGPAPQPREHLQAFIDWAQVNPLGRGVGCLLISTQPPGGEFGTHRMPVVGFARGYLQAAQGALTGDLTEYFSDRSAGPSAAPFDPTRTEQVGLSLSIDSLSGAVTAELVAHAWGDARQILQSLTMDNGLLIGTGASVGNQTAAALYALSLYTVEIPG